MYRVHGAAVHTGIPIGSSTTGQNTPFPIVSQPKKELLPIILAAAIWGYAWKGKAVLCHCDNVAVVTIINTGTSKEPEAMALLHRLFFIAARNNLLITPAHLPGSSNQAADARSRNNLQPFSTFFPQVNPHPSGILINLPVVSKPDLTSQSWNEMFNAIFNHSISHVKKKNTVATYKSAHPRYLDFCHRSSISIPNIRERFIQV